MDEPPDTRTIKCEFEPDAEILARSLCWALYNISYDNATSNIRIFCKRVAVGQLRELRNRGWKFVKKEIAVENSLLSDGSLPRAC